MAHPRADMFYIYLYRKKTKNLVWKCKAFGMLHCPEVLWHDCSNYAPGVKKGPANAWGGGCHLFYIEQKAIGNG